VQERGEEGKSKAQVVGQERARGGGSGRLWAALEKAVFEKFRQRQAIE